MLALAPFALAALVATAVEIGPERTAYDMIADGRVRAVEIGAHRVAVPESEVPRFLNNHAARRIRGGPARVLSRPRRQRPHKREAAGLWGLGGFIV